MQNLLTVNPRTRLPKEPMAIIRNARASFKNATRAASRNHSLHLPQLKPAGSMEATPGAIATTIPAAPASKVAAKAATEAEEEAEMDTKDAAMEAVAKKDSLHLPQMKPAGSTVVTHGAIAITIPAAPASRDAAKEAVQEAEEDATMDTKDTATEAVAMEAVAEMEMEITISTRHRRQLKSRDNSKQNQRQREPRGTRQSSIIST